MASSEAQVQCTNDSATLSKCSTSNAGYYYDPFVPHFVTHCPRRAPLIHWGYWIRHLGLEWVQNGFLDQYNGNKQILSLGAGFDTTYFKLSSNGKLHHTVYIEVDYPEVITRKESIISTSNMLSHDDNYKLIGCDITNLELLEQLLTEKDISRDTPTLIMAEVVLTYIKPNKVDALFGLLAQFFSNAICCIYEQINPSDGFGQVMLNHFRTISSPLLNIGTYPTQTDYQNRFKKHGWTDVISCDMNSFYNHLPSDIRSKPLSLEAFDEYEEWHLKCAHYQLLCALTGDCTDLYTVLSPPLIRCNEVMDNEERERWTCTWDGTSTWELQRFGHASVPISHDTLLLYGGFGSTGPNLSQSRLESLISVDLHTQTVTQVPSRGDKLPGPLVYHTLTLLPTGQVLLIGGRGSPQRPNSCVYLLETLTSGIWNWELMDLTNKDVADYSPRWRHTANLVSDSIVMIIGGCTMGRQALNDIWLLDTVNRSMDKVPLTLPRGRHSHVTVTTGDNELMVIGGLGSDLCPCSSALRFSKSECHWEMKKVAFFPPLLPRYSMSAHLVGTNKLLLVGGVEVNSSNQPAPIVLIDLCGLTWRNIDINFPVEVPLPLLHNHVSCVIPADQSTALLIFGGGGNCFSFGTRFNCPLRINMIL